MSEMSGIKHCFCAGTATEEKQLRQQTSEQQVLPPRFDAPYYNPLWDWIPAAYSAARRSAQGVRRSSRMRSSKKLEVDNNSTQHALTQPARQCQVQPGRSSNLVMPTQAASLNPQDSADNFQPKHEDRQAQPDQYVNHIRFDIPQACPVCMAPFSATVKQPIVLQCGHAFCADCVLRFTTAVAEASAGLRLGAKCPLDGSIDWSSMGQMRTSYALIPAPSPAAAVAEALHELEDDTAALAPSPAASASAVPSALLPGHEQYQMLPRSSTQPVQPPAVVRYSRSEPAKSVRRSISVDTVHTSYSRVADSVQSVHLQRAVSAQRYADVSNTLWQQWCQQYSKVYGNKHSFLRTSHRKPTECSSSQATSASQCCNSNATGAGAVPIRTATCVANNTEGAIGTLRCSYDDDSLLNCSTGFQSFEADKQRQLVKLCAQLQREQEWARHLQLKARKACSGAA